MRIVGASGEAFWDPIGSIAIGVLWCAVAFLLASVTHGLLIGESATAEDQGRALEVSGELGQKVDVALDRLRGIVTQLHVLNQPLSQGSHGGHRRQEETGTDEDLPPS